MIFNNDKPLPSYKLLVLTQWYRRKVIAFGHVGNLFLNEKVKYLLLKYVFFVTLARFSYVAISFVLPDRASNQSGKRPLKRTIPFDLQRNVEKLQKKRPRFTGTYI